MSGEEESPAEKAAKGFSKFMDEGWKRVGQARNITHSHPEEAQPDYSANIVNTRFRLEDGSLANLSGHARSQTANLNGDFDVNFSLFQYKLGGDKHLPGYKAILVEERPDEKGGVAREETELGTTSETGTLQLNLNHEQVVGFSDKKLEIKNPDGTLATTVEIGKIRIDPKPPSPGWLGNKAA